MDTGDKTSTQQSYSIYFATASCRDAFEECLSNPTLMHDRWAENRLLDFKLWASGVGALAEPSAGLDYRLGTQPDVRAVVLGLLSTLQAVVHLCVHLGASPGLPYGICSR
jgi:hypothetical protein